MSANRRRHINALPGVRLLVFLSTGAVLLVTGLGYVYCQNELHRMLGEVGKLEKDCQQLRTIQLFVSPQNDEMLPMNQC